MATLHLDGKPYTVTDQFARALRSLGELRFKAAAVRDEIDGWLKLSNDRELLPNERARMDNLTHVWNIHNTIRVVGAHHSPEEFGLDGWDAVHGQHEGKDCGCVLQRVFDHHSVLNHFGHNRVKKEMTDKDLHVVEPRRSCPAHAHLRSDHKRHYARVVADHDAGRAAAAREAEAGA